MDLSKINWQTISVSGDDSTYSVNSSNVNVSIDDNFKKAVKKTVDNSDKFELNLEMPSLEELSYGEKMIASKPSDEQSRALDHVGSTSVDAYQESAGGPDVSYSLDGNILTVNVKIPDGYGYISDCDVDVKDKSATLDLTVSYHNATYKIEFNDLNVKYNT